MAGSRRQWGWHRLHPRWAEQLVAASGSRPGDLVLDVGAGDGVITDSPAEPRRQGHRRRAPPAARRRAALPLRAPTSWSSPPTPAISASPAGRSTSSPTHRSPSRARCCAACCTPAAGSSSARLVLDERAIARWVSSSAPAAGRWQEHSRSSSASVLPRRAFDPPTGCALPRAHAAAPHLSDKLGLHEATCPVRSRSPSPARRAGAAAACEPGRLIRRPSLPADDHARTIDHRSPRRARRLGDHRRRDVGRGPPDHGGPARRPDGTARAGLRRHPRRRAGRAADRRRSSPDCRCPPVSTCTSSTR